MTRLMSIGLVIWVLFDVGESISSKMDFSEERESNSSVTDSSKENDDVEVKHTIVVSTKLKNNNRRGLHGADKDTRFVSDENGHNKNIKMADSGEIPVIKGYKAVDSTQIRTPDTRRPDPLYVRQNTPDEYDTYPNIAANPAQWKPSNYYNNINWWSQDNIRRTNNFLRRYDRPSLQNSGNQRRLSDNAVRDFYCRKCREMNGELRGCNQQQSNLWSENTTKKIKLDGKLVKLK